jgi:hypothetical protein
MNSIQTSSIASDRLVSLLQSQQHLRPHQTVGEALDQVRRQAGFAAGLAGEAIDLLQLDVSRKIGRLKGCEVTQLARAVWRLWKQAAVGA